MSVTPPAPPTSPPVTPPPTSTVPPCQEWSENRTINCPLGQVGQVFQSRRHHCGTDPSVYEAWAGSTTAGSWTTTNSTCTPCPAPETRNVGCPAGQFGAIGQQRIFSCTGTGSWNAWTQTNTTCTACPAPFPQAETQWVTTAAACPAGQSGSHTWQTEQRRTRTGSYNCPATTWSLPSPTFTTWTNWAETGVRRNEAITCTPTHHRRRFPNTPGDLGIRGETEGTTAGRSSATLPGPWPSFKPPRWPALGNTKRTTPHVYARATWRDPPNTGFGSLCLRAARQLDSDARLRLRQPPRHRGLAGGLLVQRRGSRRAVLLARPGSERLGGL